jgi:hypothetical protein
MDSHALSENVGAIAIIIATVIFATIIYTVLSGLAMMDNPGVTRAKFDADVIMGTGASGVPDTPVIRIHYLEGPALPLNGTEVRLTSPEGVSFGVMAAILHDRTIEAGDVWYLFHYDHSDPFTTGYWITDEPDLVFSTLYQDRCVAEPFSPPGRWKLEISDIRYRKQVLKAYLDIG